MTIILVLEFLAFIFGLYAIFTYFPTTIALIISFLLFANLFKSFKIFSLRDDLDLLTKKLKSLSVLNQDYDFDNDDEDK